MTVRPPVTMLGVAAAVGAVAALVGGWMLGWIELTVFGTGCALALLVAVPFVVGRMRLDIERFLSDDRILSGESVEVGFRFHNRGATPSRPRRLIDAVDGEPSAAVQVPMVASGGYATRTYGLDALPRGYYRVGPAVINRADPLRLLERADASSGASELWVHPRYEPVSALPLGFAKDLEGPTSETSPAGDVAFHSLRPYEFGDDYRHIHWLSTARVGEPMVRHYVDNRRPYLGVLLDTRADSYPLPGDGPGPDTRFESAVEVAACLGVASCLHRAPLTIWTDDGPVIEHGAALDRDDVLDRLCRVRPGTGRELSEAATTITRTSPGISAVAIITGALPAEALLGVVNELKRRVGVIVVRVHDGALIGARVPGAHTIDVTSRAEFVASWEAFVR